MSTSPVNSDDRLGPVAQSFRCAKDEGLLSALSSVPNFPFGDATSHLVDRKSDDHVQPATTLSPEMAGDSGVQRPPMTILPPHGRHIHRPHRNKPRPPHL